jgi:hypothetical protein
MGFPKDYLRNEFSAEKSFVKKNILILLREKMDGGVGSESLKQNI